MSNELGNKLLHDLLHAYKDTLIKNGYEDPNIVNEIIESIMSQVKIFNLMDASISPTYNADTESIINKFQQSADENIVIPVNYTSYADVMLVYGYAFPDAAQDALSVNLFIRMGEYRLVVLHSMFDKAGNGYTASLISQINIELGLNGMTVTSFEDDNDIIFKYYEYATIYAIMNIFKAINQQENKCNYVCYRDSPRIGSGRYVKQEKNAKAIKILDKPVIIVLRDTPKKDKILSKHRFKHGHIDYSFSFAVRGHYRKLHNPETIGKDRNGDRTIQGYTWVENYIKGNTDLPVRKRVTCVLDRRKVKINGE